jgi:S-adenosylmethionine-dependent methyltransferase
VPTNAHVFDSHKAAFQENQNMPWGRLRYSLGRAHLFRHLDHGPLQILDVGGGSGLDAVPLAQMGHTVTIADYSSEMLAEARQSAADNGVSDRLTFHQAGLDSITTLFTSRQFDAVLCHNVLQYVDDLDVALKTISAVLRPGGWLSIICLNRYSETYRQALHQLNLSAALANVNADTIMTVIYGVPAKAYAVEDMREPLRVAGCEVLGEYGIRCVCDYIQSNEIKDDPIFFEQLEKLELAVSDKHPYRSLGRFFQVVARKH